MMFASAVFGSNQKLFGVSGCAARLARKHHDSLQYVMRPPEFENLPYHELGVDVALHKYKLRASMALRILQSSFLCWSASEPRWLDI
jgi:hypothetical protein